MNKPAYTPSQREGRFFRTLLAVAAVSAFGAGVAQGAVSLQKAGATNATPTPLSTEGFNGGFAQIWTIGKDSTTVETSVAATSLLLFASAGGDQTMHTQVSAPNALYYPTWQAEQANQRADLTVNSLTDMRRRCIVRSIDACVQIAAIHWSCDGAKGTEVYSRVRLSDAGKITSVTADTAPIICRVTRE